MPEQDPQSEADRAIIEWGWLLETVLGVALLGGTGMVVHYYTPVPLPANDLQRQVQQIRQQLDQMEQEHGMPAMVLNRYRNSICYIYGVYRVGFPGEPTSVRARIAGTGFVVADGLLATNRHVAEPWYGDPEAQALIQRGATAKLEKLLAYFPEMATPIDIDPVVVSPLHDLALVHMGRAPGGRTFPPLPLADRAGTPGELVTVIG